MVEASHDAFEATVHVQAASLAVTCTLPVPTAAPTDELVGLMA